jgi:hypothetical protein
MVEAIYLAALAIILAVFLYWRKIPRPDAVRIWSDTLAIYVLSFFLSNLIFDHFANKFEDGIFPYLPPVIPAYIYLLWQLRRLRRNR